MHIELCRRAAAEGMVLLENRDNALPLRQGEAVALFGNGSVDYVKGGGGGSGIVYAPLSLHRIRHLLNQAAPA